MALSKHVHPDRLIQESKDKPSGHAIHTLLGGSPGDYSHAYSGRYGTTSVPKYKIPSTGTDEEHVYRTIHDELSLDGSPLLNLASFVQTYLPEKAEKLVQENAYKNLIDQDEYPMTQVIHTRCVSMLADLWHAPSTHGAIGTATTGSSEAIQLGGLAMKRLWQQRRKEKNLSIHEPGPNIVMGSNAQVALEKFARYFDVECRLVPISKESRYRLDPQKAMQYIDENTIGVFVILGSTYTGHYEPVKEMADLLDEYEKNTGVSIPIHVDAASGGFVAPFASPKLVWDFKIHRVVSINTSGHKFGLSPVGVGWVVWRSKHFLPKDLIFELHYLGSVEYSFSLNFSRPASPIIAQYFMFLHLGFAGYRAVALQDLKNARTLSRALEKSGYYEVLSEIHRPVSPIIEGVKSALRMDEGDVENYVPGLPVVAFRFSEALRTQYPDVDQKWIQTLLRSKGWIVPNYELAPDLSDISILRVVVRETASEVLIERLVTDIIDITESLIKADTPAHALSVLSNSQGHGRRHEIRHGVLDEGSGSTSSGTYAKQC